MTLLLIHEQLNTLTKQQEEKFEKLEKMLEESRKEVDTLKTTVETLNETVAALKTKVFDLEHHSRLYSIRAFNIEIDGNSADTTHVTEQLYTKALLPILRGAVSCGRLKSIPDCDSIIEIAHVLPGKEGKPKPIICRFYSRRIRTLILQCRKEYAPRANTPGPSRRPPPYLYPLYEDMAAEAHHLLQQLKANEEVSTAWVSGGTIRFKIKEIDTVFRVNSVFDKIETIIAKAKNS